MTRAAPREPTLRAALDVLAAASLWGSMYAVSAATFERIPPVTSGGPLVALIGAFRAIFGASLVAIVVLLPLAPLELAGRTLPPLE